MLLQINIKNFALIDYISVEFKEGFNILSGETGAGKSILIDAISYVLGGKFNRDTIRTGADKTYVEAIFSLEQENVIKVLEELNIEIEDVLIISRETFQNGKSVVKVNGKTLILSQLRKITEKLLDVHGQHANQNLLNPSTHIFYLDTFGENKINENLNEYKELREEYLQVENKLKEILGEEDRDKKIDYIQFQIADIEKANLKIGEEEELNEQYKILSNSEKIASSFKNAYSILKEGRTSNSVIDELGTAIREVSSVEDSFEKAKKINEELNNVYYLLDEIAASIRDSMSDIFFDESELENINQRIYEISLYKKKYGDSVESILNYYNKIKNEYEDLINAEEVINSLNIKKQEIADKMNEVSMKLHEERLNVAEILEKEIIDELSYIGLGKCKIKIEVNLEEEFNSLGKDKVTFLVSTNPGEPLKGLDKVVSGGELSRIMLALKTVFVDKDFIPTVIFDEIDTGISGPIAQCVGEKMYQISNSHQVLCITHLTQIAALSDNHYYVSKDVHNGRTYTKIRLLTLEEKVREIAKMNSGAELTEMTIENAREMIKLGEEKKKIIRQCT